MWDFCLGCALNIDNYYSRTEKYVWSTYPYSVYKKYTSLNRKVLMLLASEMKWGWRNCFVAVSLRGSCFLFSLPLRKAATAYIREKNPLNFLSGSHSGYMIKKECISLSRAWIAWPGEKLGPVIPWESDKFWSLDFFLCIHIILVRCSLHSAVASMWFCTNP